MSFPATIFVVAIRKKRPNLGNRLIIFSIVQQMDYFFSSR